MLKSASLLVIFTLVTRISFGQTDKENWLIGGNFDLSTVKNSSAIAVSPMAGYFFANHFALGGNISLIYTKIGDNKSTTFGIGPFTRYYFGRSSIKPFLHGELGFLTNRQKTPGTQNTENGVSYLLGIGTAVFINQNVAIEGLTGYVHSKIKNFDGEGGFAFRIGFQVYLHANDLSTAGN